jgi:hypothetical protein
MKQVTLAAAALLAAIFLSGNAPAMAASLAGSSHTGAHARVKPGCCHRRGCDGCGFYSYTVYPSCGRRDLYAYSPYAACPGYGYGGYGLGRGWGFSGWLY